MRSLVLQLLLAATTVTTLGLLAAQQVAKIAPQSKPDPPSAPPATPMILQEADGDHLVHRAGPLRGVPFSIKVDGEFGNSNDFFVFAEALKPGQTIPFHKHENAEELLILRESGAMVMVGNKRAAAGPDSIVFIPRDTWISATNTGDKDLHTLAVFSRHGFESYMRAISAKPGQPLAPLTQDELTQLRSAAHAVYWDTSKGPYPPDVAHP
jgi:mannose-6-phosphate isomerase-like protein (cupin superfamily)